VAGENDESAQFAKIAEKAGQGLPRGSPQRPRLRDQQEKPTLQSAPGLTPKFLPDKIRSPAPICCAKLALMRFAQTALAIVLMTATSSFGQDRSFGLQDFPPPSEPEYFDESSEDLEVPPAPPTAEELLAELALTENEEDAEDIERRLRTLWSRSGSATADLLFARSDEAMEADEFEIAEQLLAELTDLAPNFAEGWHRHAIIELRQEHFEEAMASLRHTLSLEPKHFLAMAELGSILEEFGDTTRALAAYREALAINPFIDGLEERVRELTRNVEGQGI